MAFLAVALLPTPNTLLKSACAKLPKPTAADAMPSVRLKLPIADELLPIL